MQFTEEDFRELDVFLKTKDLERALNYRREEMCGRTMNDIMTLVFVSGGEVRKQDFEEWND